MIKKILSIIKKIISGSLDRYDWISLLIETPFWAIFWFGGVYILFVISIQPWWWKLVFFAILCVLLYVSFHIIERIIFKKMGRKPPI